VAVGSIRESEAASAERVARNDAAFREANEAIRSTAETWDMEGLLPVLCECADTSCTTILRLTPEEYEGVRADPRTFINAAGHHVSAQGWARVVAEHERYTVVEKVGEAAEIVEELDPRSEGATDLRS
jgi:hypothetical protein